MCFSLCACSVNSFYFCITRGWLPIYGCSHQTQLSVSNPCFSSCLKGSATSTAVEDLRQLQTLVAALPRDYWRGKAIISTSRPHILAVAVVQLSAKPTRTIIRKTSRRIVGRLEYLNCFELEFVYHCVCSRSHCYSLFSVQVSGTGKAAPLR